MTASNEVIRQQSKPKNDKPMPVASDCFRQAAAILGVYGKILAELRTSPAIRQ